MSFYTLWAGVLMDAAGCALACVPTVVSGCDAGDVSLLKGAAPDR
ncbi:hypothetical protein [Pseudomonas syringae]|nr:hypothetical protein [Pseudomonas syringae]